MELPLKFKDLSHKVVLVLDHGCKFTQYADTLCTITGKDIGSDGKTDPLAKEVKRQLWSWCLEASQEFYRVVSDLFPTSNKLIRVAVADSVGRMLQAEWGEKLISPDEMYDALAGIGPASSGEDTSMAGKAAMMVAIEALSQKSSQQKETQSNDQPGQSNRSDRNPLSWNKSGGLSRSGHIFDPPTSNNNGALIHFTHFKTQDEMDDFMNEIAELIESRNKIISNLGDPEMEEIGTVHAYFINVTTDDAKVAIENKDMLKVAQHLWATIITVPAGEKLLAAVHKACVSLYDLVSTTVCGIPMREEAKHGQSISYDVELLHPRETHSELYALKLTESCQVELSGSERLFTSFRLSWVTAPAKSAWEKVPRCINSMPVTPSAFNSRPSVCMTSYVLGGRSVLLEIQKDIVGSKKLQHNYNDKLISHTLMAHQGRIFMHAFQVAPTGPGDFFTGVSQFSVKSTEKQQKKKNLEITSKEGTARYLDFSALMKQAILRPGAYEASSTPDLINEQAQRHLKRITRYFPLYQEDTFIFRNPKPIEPLLTKIRRLTLSPADIEACKKVFQFLVGELKTAKDGICDQRFAEKCRILKSDSQSEQYRVALLDIAKYMANYVNHSSDHLELFNHFLGLTALDRSHKFPTSDVDLNDNAPRNSNQVTISTHTGHSSRSPSPVPSKRPRKGHGFKKGEIINVYDFLRGEEDRKAADRWRDFVGRVESCNAQIAPLYKGIDFSNAPARGEVQ